MHWGGENTYVLVYEKMINAVCSRSSSSECLSSETEASQEAGTSNEEKEDKAHSPVQNGVLESSDDRNVSGMGEASQDESSASHPVPDIPLPLQGMQRSRGRTFSLVDAFSDRRSLVNRCGAACSHSGHDTSDTSQQQSSSDKHME